MDKMNLYIDDRIKGVEKYWKDLVPIMEEADDLFQCIIKYERFLLLGCTNEDALMKDMEKEISELLIVVGALISRYNLDPMTIEQYYNDKLNKKY